MQTRSQTKKIAESLDKRFSFKINVTSQTAESMPNKTKLHWFGKRMSPNEPTSSNINNEKQKKDKSMRHVCILLSVVL